MKCFLGVLLLCFVSVNCITACCPKAKIKAATAVAIAIQELRQEQNQSRPKLQREVTPPPVKREKRGPVAKPVEVPKRYYYYTPPTVSYHLPPVQISPGYCSPRG